MPIASRLVVFGALVGVLATPDAETNLSAHQGYTLTIPVSGAAAAVRCEYFADLRGGPPESGLTDWGRVAAQPGTVVIDGARARTPSTRVDLAFIYCPGFSFTALRNLPFSDSATQAAAIHPVPLPTVPLKGRVTLPPAEKSTVGTVDVSYGALWITESYGAWDGVIPQFQIASVPLAEDGTFMVDLPDFSRDSWVAKCKSRGWFQFFVRGGAKTYGLEPPAENRDGFYKNGLIVTPGARSLEVAFSGSR